MSKSNTELPQEGTTESGESLPAQSCSQRLSPGCPTESGGGKFRLNEQSKNNQITNHKILSQQVFHRSMFTNRRRSNSFNSHPTDRITSAGISTTDENSSDVEQNEEWTEIRNKKRLRSSPEALIRSQKQTKLNYWLAAPTPTSNSFSALNNDPVTTEVLKPSRPPPIFVDRVNNIQPLTKMLHEVAVGDFEIKIFKTDQVKIQAKSPESYSTIYKELKKRNTEFFTYQPKEERSFRVVLKKIHHSTDPEDIKFALEELNHEVRNVWNIKHRQTKKPLNIFYIDLKPQSNNKNVYNVKSILNCIVTFEAPRAKREIPQCTNCQQYGHTKKFCHREAKCVKCAGAHHTSECPRKERSDKVKCILCDGNHPANYKGCTVYKELQKIQYPTPYQRKNWKQNNAKPSLQKDEKENSSKNYSAILQQNLQPVRSTNRSTDTQNLPSSETTLLKINETMQTIMNQILSLTKLLTELMSKLALHSDH